VSRFEALFVDFGGVLTSNVFEAFGDFCASQGLARDAFATLLRDDPAAAGLLRDVETGALAEPEFEARFAPMLGAGIEPAGLIGRLSATLRPDGAMLDALGRIHDAGHTTAIVSNSFGYGAYDGYELERRVDDVVLSGDVGVRKPSRRIYRLAAERAGVAPERCVFVDDLPQNVAGAERAGMRGIHHTEAAVTLPQLEALFDLELAAT
jgi:putative hydrolase of the HAD superfamily